MTQTDWTPFLGPTADEMTEDQRETFDRWADKITAHYSDISEGEYIEDHIEESTAELNVTVRWLLRETSLDDAGRRLASARAEVREAMAAAQQVARLAHADGVQKSEISRQLGLTRPTVDTALYR